MHMLKNLVKQGLLALGYELKRPTKLGWYKNNLRKQWLQPRTVVDVGVAYGTPKLYEAFPESYHVLVEPLGEYKPYLQDILRNYKGEYILAAVGGAMCKSGVCR